MGVTFCSLWCDSYRLERLSLDGMVPLWARNTKKLGRWPPLCLFWMVWKERNKIAFDNKELSSQRLKISFVCSFCS